MAHTRSVRKNTALIVLIATPWVLYFLIMIMMETWTSTSRIILPITLSECASIIWKKWRREQIKATAFSAMTMGTLLIFQNKPELIIMVMGLLCVLLT